jgi:hypothetical protein
MRTTWYWPLVLLLAAGCSGGDTASQPDKAAGAGPDNSAHDASGIADGYAPGGGQPGAKDALAPEGQSPVDGLGSQPAGAAAGGSGSQPGQQVAAGSRDLAGAASGTGGDTASQPGGDTQAAKPEEPSPGGAAIRSLGEGFLRALGRAALSGTPPAREPPAAEDDPFPEGEPPESPPEQGEDSP